VFAKALHSRPDSAPVRAHLLDGATLLTSKITRFELHAAARRKEAVGGILPQGAGPALAAYDADVASGLALVAALNPAVVAIFEVVVRQCYGRIPAVMLRTLDAIHLATATHLGESEIVATDRRLREAAAFLGFSLYPQ
jgi:predicted nucleic acid-binding protein